SRTRCPRSRTGPLRLPRCTPPRGPRWAGRAQARAARVKLLVHAKLPALASRRRERTPGCPGFRLLTGKTPARSCLMTALDQPVARTAYQQSVASYWNAEKDPVNLRLGDVDGLYHHHYGLGDYDPAVLEAPEATRDEAIIAEMHRLETAQAEVLLDHLGPIAPSDRLLDAGCGRGGTSVMAHLRFG